MKFANIFYVKLLRAFFVTSFIFFICSCDGNILTEEKNSTVGNNFDNDGRVRLGFSGNYPPITSLNGSNYFISGQCQLNYGEVVVTFEAPAITQSFLCSDPGDFSGTINLTGLASSPAVITAIQGELSATLSPAPLNDQIPILTAPIIADQPLVGGVNNTLTFSCNEAGELVSFTGTGLNPNTQNFNCTAPGLATTNLFFASSIETTSSHTITVSSLDSFGNPTTNNTNFVLPIENQAPLVVVSSGPDIIEGQTANFIISVSDSNISSFNYNFVLSSGIATPSTCTTNPCNISVTGANPGVLSLMVRANSINDNLGNTGPVANVTESLTVADDPSPVITSLSLVSTDGDSDGWFETSDSVTLSVVYSEIVTVSGGTPSLSTNLSSGAKSANYLSGSGSNTLRFAFSVSGGDELCNGILNFTGLNLNGATIRDSIGQNAINSGLPSSLSGVRIDTTVPNISGPMDISANNAEVTGRAVTASWPSHSDNCSVANISMALGTHDGTSCNVPTAITRFVDLSNTMSFQPVSGVLPYIGADNFTLSPLTNYCTSVMVEDAAGHSRQLSSAAWQALNVLVLNSGAYEFADGTFARSCNAYFNSSGYQSEGSGLYRIDLDGTGGNSEFVAQCDMTSCGGIGGWTLVLNYLRRSGENTSVTVRNSSTPIIGSTTLGDDESLSPTTWGHASNSLMSQFGFTDVRYHCKTSAHSRELDFFVFDPNTINYYQSGTGGIDIANYNSSARLCEGHSATAFLPGATTNQYINRGNNAMTEFPFWRGGRYHWGIRGAGRRWECDDYSNGFSIDTYHQIWVR